MTRLGTSERLGKTERYTVKIVIRMVTERMKRIPSLKLTAKLPETMGLEDDPFLLIFRPTNRCELLVFGGGTFSVSLRAYLFIQ